MSQKKKKADKAFIEKIKSLTIGTGAKPDDTCGVCGNPISHHILGAIVHLKRDKQKKNSGSDEMSFSA